MPRKRKRNVKGFFGIYALYVVGLHVIPGPWKDWKRGRWIDKWTLTHILWGAIAQRYGVSQGEIVLMAAGNEAFEAWLRRNRPDVLWGTPEPWKNVAVDIGTSWAGWKLGAATK